jgi:hypothetical protein
MPAERAVTSLAFGPLLVASAAALALFLARTRATVSCPGSGEAWICAALAATALAVTAWLFRGALREGWTARTWRNLALAIGADVLLGFVSAIVFLSSVCPIDADD